MLINLLGKLLFETHGNKIFLHPKYPFKNTMNYDNIGNRLEVVDKIIHEVL